MSVVSGIWGAESSESAAKDAAHASKYAAKAQAKGEMAKLDYLKESEAIPRQLREGALTSLGGVYGLSPSTGGQQDLIDRAKNSPIYGAMLDSKEMGEESILRNASATGGLRSGSTQENLYDYNVQLENNALLASYNEQLSGLAGMAGLGSNANAIGNAIAAPGRTLAQGHIGAAQAMQVGSQNQTSNILELGKLGLSAYDSGLLGSFATAGTATTAAAAGTGVLGAVGTAAGAVGSGIASAVGWMFSDKRLKKDIKKITEVDGFNIYSWKWNSVAEQIGLFGTTVGCMADEVFEVRPDCVFLKDGFQIIAYPQLHLSIFNKEEHHAS